MDKEITPEFKKACEEHYKSMDDNTEIDDPQNQLKFVKMRVSAEHIDFLMNYYKLSNVMEVNQAAIYVLKSFAHMELDGYKFGLFKTKMVDGKEVCDQESSFGLNISDMIKNILKQIEK